MMKLILSIAILTACTHEARERPESIFSRFLRNRNVSRDSTYDEDDSYEIKGYSLYVLEDPRPYDISVDEYYEDAVRTAFEILGEHRETIISVVEQLDQGTEEWRQHFPELRDLLDSAQNLITKNVITLKEKFASRLITPEDMTQPVEKSTMESLLSTWNEVRPALEKLKPNEKIEELKKWLQNVDHKTRTQYDNLESLMAKIKATLAGSREREQRA